MTKKEALLLQMDDIMDEFDFKKVESVMKHLNWTWQDDKYPPEEIEIRKQARKLMKQAIEIDQWVSTGGFEVQIVSGEENGKKWTKLNLSFSVESTINDGVDYE